MTPLILDTDNEAIDGSEIEKTLMDSLNVIFGGRRVKGECHEFTGMLGNDIVSATNDDGNIRFDIDNYIDVSAYPKHSRFFIVANPRGKEFFWIVAVPYCTVYRG
jgi:hypothetical protein